MCGDSFLETAAQKMRSEYDHAETLV